MKASILVLASVVAAAPVHIARQAAGLGSATESIITGATDGVNDVASEEGVKSPALNTVTDVINAVKDTVGSFTSGLDKRQEVHPYTVGLDYIVNGPVDGLEAVTDEQGDVGDAALGELGLPRRQLKGYTQSVDDFINGPLLGAEEFTSDQGYIIDATTGEVKEMVTDVV